MKLYALQVAYKKADLEVNSVHLVSCRLGSDENAIRNIIVSTYYSSDKARRMNVKGWRCVVTRLTSITEERFEELCKEFHCDQFRIGFDATQPT